MTLSCKNMRIQVNENKKEDIGQSKRITIAKDYILDASNKKEHISEDSTLCVGESLEQTVGDLKTSVIEGDLIFSAQGRALVQGKTDARISRE
jgi:rhs element vgr protein family protein (fragment)